MMKKNGFTLAEVLITLAIIGVVATLTLPALMTNTQEQQARTAFRKAINTLSEVAQLNAAADGFDFSGITDTTAPSADGDIYDADTGTLQQSIWAMLSSKAQVNMTDTTRDAAIPGACADLNHVIFQDGTALCYPPEETTAGDDRNDNNVMQAVIDTNGFRGPNELSTCDVENCTNVSEKNIKDQFAVTLRGSNVIPGHVEFGANSITDAEDEESFAARWAVRK